MHRIESTGRKFDSFYISMRKILESYHMTEHRMTEHRMTELAQSCGNFAPDLDQDQWGRKSGSSKNPCSD